LLLYIFFGNLMIEEFAFPIFSLACVVPYSVVVA